MYNRHAFCPVLSLIALSLCPFLFKIIVFCCIIIGLLFGIVWAIAPFFAFCAVDCSFLSVLRLLFSSLVMPLTLFCSSCNYYQFLSYDLVPFSIWNDYSFFFSIFARFFLNILLCSSYDETWEWLVDVEDPRGGQRAFMGGLRGIGTLWSREGRGEVPAWYNFQSDLSDIL